MKVQGQRLHGYMNVSCDAEHQKYVESGEETRFEMYIARNWSVETPSKSYNLIEKIS